MKFLRLIFFIAIVMLCCSLGVKAQTSYFRVDNKIPYLPVFTSKGDVTNPLPGAIIFDSTDSAPYMYTGTDWIDMCSFGVFDAVNSVNWFRVVNGVPCLPVLDEQTIVAPVGTLFYPTTGTGLQLSDGVEWTDVYAFNAKENIATNEVPAMGNITGAPGAFVVPVLAAEPTVSVAGAFYIDAVGADFKIFDGTGWLTIDCSNCPPLVTGVFVNGDFERMTSNDFYDGGYAYYDKENDPEVEAAASFRWFLSTEQDGAGTVTPLSTDQSYTYTYTDADDGLFLNLGVIVQGTTQQGVNVSEETIFSALLYNCPPSISGALLDLDGLTYNTVEVLPHSYAYYDKEGNDEGVTVTNWYMADDNTGTNETSLGTGDDYSYTYSDADQGKYMRVGYIPKALTGFSTGDETYSPYAQIYNCPPNASGVTLLLDGWTYSEAGILPYNYLYYDKEDNQEATSALSWMIADDNTGLNESERATGADYVYTFQDADQGKYVRLGVIPKAQTGYSTGDTVFSGYHEIFNCPPEMKEMYIAGDFDKMSSSDFKLGGYIYWDKENDPEDLAATEYHWYLSSEANGAGTTSELSTAGGYTYTYADADRSKYLNLEMVAHASKGYSVSNTTIYSALLENCEPQVTGVTLDLDGVTYTTAELLPYSYAYYDKEGNAEGTSVVTWYMADDASGTNEAELGTGASYQYTYADADQNKYVRVGVTPMAQTGTLDGAVEVYSSYEQVYNCPPVISEVSLLLDEWTYSETDVLPYNYLYYDKEDNPEGTSELTWYIADDNSGTNEAELGTGDSYQYAYSDADQGKYVRLGVTPKASGGYSTGDVVSSGYHEIFNCPPEMREMYIAGDFDKMSSSDFKLGGYIYWDKENDPEDLAATEYHWYLSSEANGAGTTEELSTAGDYTYTYADADRSKYLNLEMVAHASKGYSVSNTTIYSALLENCEPQVTGVTLDLDNVSYSTPEVLPYSYAYYDKEGNLEGETVVTWFIADDFNGTNEVELGTGASYQYTYADADQNKYIRLSVSPRAQSGFSYGDTVFSFYKQVYNCPPVISEVSLLLDEWTYSETDVLPYNYLYYDKEDNPEGISELTWFIADDNSGTNEAELGTGASYQYAYSDADQGKYVRLGVTPKASGGYSTGDVVFSGYQEIYNCPPEMKEMYIAGDFDKMSSSGFKLGGYIYWDKENDPEDLAATEYHWYLSSEANGVGTTEELSTAGDYTYTYTDADRSKYLNLEMIAHASKGYSVSNTTIYSGLLENCEPQVYGVTLDLDNVSYSTPEVLPYSYAYYDKEGNAEGTSVVTWYMADDASGTNEAELGTGVSYQYTYADADQNKYVRVGVTPMAQTGTLDGAVEVYSSYEQIYNCPPVISEVSLLLDEWTYSETDVLPYNYLYYDKEDNPEGTSELTWYMADDNSGTNEAELGTGDSYQYAYSDADQGKYVRLSVTPKASGGYSTGDVVSSGYHEIFNCPPEVKEMYIAGDFDKMSSSGFKLGGYIYWDKENDPEDLAATEYHWYLSSAANGVGTTEELSTAGDYTYTYTDADRGKYLNLEMVAHASKGYSVSNTTIYSGLLENCEPQVYGVTLDLDNVTYNTAELLPYSYAYYDKEGNAEGTSVVTWYMADDASGTNEAELGTGVSYQYTYADADQNKYVRVGVTPMAQTGTLDGAVEVYSSYEQIYNCPPVISEVSLLLDDWYYSEAVVLPYNYLYYDKEDNSEGPSELTWYIADDASGTNEATRAAGASFVYTYQDADQGKYIRLGVTPKATTGYSTGDEAFSSYWEIFNCPPEIKEMYIAGDFDKMTSNDFKLGGYIYWDKENDPEDLAATEYRWYLSSAANGVGTTSELSTASDYTYTYTDADRDKYLNLELIAHASKGYSVSNTTIYSALLENCEPQIGGLRVDGTTTSGLTLYAGYTYFDKEENAENNSAIQWYRATDAAGTGEVAISGATAASYTLTAGDIGYYIGVKVTPKAVSGTLTGVETTAYATTIVN